MGWDEQDDMILMEWDGMGWDGMNRMTWDGTDGMDGMGWDGIG